MRKVSPSTALRVNGERSRTVKLFTLGCKVNQYDTQVIRESFARAGFKEINNGAKADIYVINTCTVTSTADRKSRDLIRFSRRQNPKARIIVTGCYTELNSDEICAIPGVTHIINNQDKNRITELINEHNGLNGHNATGISSFCGHTRAFLKIQDGCNNSCSYCKVPMVRGRSQSRPLDGIVQEASKLVSNGFKEIVLCGICLGSYGKDFKVHARLSDLFRELEKIEGLSRIRLSSIEAGDISQELIQRIAQSKKICRHLHIPIQSGDDEVLKKMNRRYTRHAYIRLIKKIKSKIPGVAITTDVLLGFPGESENNFKNTVDLIKKIQPLRVHIFPYSRRNGTPAALLKDMVNPHLIKERVLMLTGVSKECALAYKKKFLNKNMDVLIESRSRGDDKYWEGYTGNYIKVLVKSEKDLNNQMVRVRLREIKGDCIEAVPMIFR